MRQTACRLGIALAILFVPGVATPATTYHVAANGDDGAEGTAEAPWRTLQHAVDRLQPGDSLLIGPGTYREAVQVRRGGTADRPVRLSARPGAHVVISGADRLDGGWDRLDGADPIYVRDWPHVFPIAFRDDGSPVLSHPDDEAHALIGRAEQVLHDGRLLRQVLRREHLAPGTFLADTHAKRLYAWLPGGGDPLDVEMEASVRDRWISAGPDAGYVHLRGITFRHAANHAQRGAFALHGPDLVRGPRGWVVEDCAFERANGPGASFSGSGHVVRRCSFRDNGQLGFGASRCHDTLVQGCRIERNNTKGYSTGWEAGGLKVALSRGFVFEGCRIADNRGSGIWYDVGNERAVVRGCTLVGNDEAGIFYEISYGLHAHDNLVVGNALRGESLGGAWGMGGITLSSSEGCVVEHNTLVGNRDGLALREHHRTTPRIDQAPDAPEVRILNRDHVLRSNIVAFSQQYSIALWLDTPFFGPHPSGDDADDPPSEDPRTLGIRLADNLVFGLPGRPEYLYGAPWRPRSRAFESPEAFSAVSGVADTSRVGDPRFTDVLGDDYRLLPDSPARALGAGMRDPSSTGR